MAKPKSLKAIEGETPMPADIPSTEGTPPEQPHTPEVKPVVRSREELFLGIVVESY